MQHQQANVIWRDGQVPVSQRFDDPYYSLEDGLAEARHVFLAGNDLPGRFRDGFHVAELGFGTGLNFLAAALAWRQSGQAGHLFFTSFEAFPMRPDEMARALAAFPEVQDIASELCTGWEAGTVPICLTGNISLNVITGDARETLPEWAGQADAWFLDGFAPARNPELWEPTLLAEVARHTAPGGTAATYSAAGAVRRALDAAGFEVSRVPGYARKRHMTKARLR